MTPTFPKDTSVEILTRMEEIKFPLGLENKEEVAIMQRLAVNFLAGHLLEVREEEGGLRYKTFRPKS